MICSRGVESLDERVVIYEDSESASFKKMAKIFCAELDEKQFTPKSTVERFWKSQLSGEADGLPVSGVIGHILLHETSWHIWTWMGDQRGIS